MADGEAGTGHAARVGGLSLDPRGRRAHRDLFRKVLRRIVGPHRLRDRGKRGPLQNARSRVTGI